MDAVLEYGAAVARSDRAMHGNASDLEAAIAAERAEFRRVLDRAQAYRAGRAA